MKGYNRLVRDKIPKTIEADGNKYNIRIADKKEHYELLEAKFEEEVKEFIEDKNIKGLAD